MWTWTVGIRKYAEATQINPTRVKWKQKNLSCFAMHMLYWAIFYFYKKKATIGQGGVIGHVYHPCKNQKELEVTSSVHPSIWLWKTGWILASQENLLPENSWWRFFKAGQKKRTISLVKGTSLRWNRKEACKDASFQITCLKLKMPSYFSSLLSPPLKNPWLLWCFPSWAPKTFRNVCVWGYLFPLLFPLTMESWSVGVMGVLKGLRMVWLFSCGVRSKNMHRWLKELEGSLVGMDVYAKCSWLQKQKQIFNRFQTFGKDATQDVCSNDVSLFAAESLRQVKELKYVECLFK